MAGEWLTVAQAAQYLGAPAWAVHKWCAQGLLERRPPGNYQQRPGLCQCGCGKATGLARWADATRGWTGKQPVRYVRGHNIWLYVSAASVERARPLLAARAAVAAAKHKVAVLAPAGSPQALLEATAELGERKAELAILTLEVPDG